MIRLDSDVEKDLRKLGHVAQKKILRFLKEKIAPSNNPRIHGKPLTGSFGGYWRYRVEDYRIISKIEDSELIVIIIKVGHRKDVYDN